jgi:hypothetical protein
VENLLLSRGVYHCAFEVSPPKLTSLSAELLVEHRLSTRGADTDLIQRKYIYSGQEFLARPTKKEQVLEK